MSPEPCIRQPGSVWTACRCPDCIQVSAKNYKLRRNGKSPILDQRAQAVARFEKWRARGYSPLVIADLTGVPARTMQAWGQGRVDPDRMHHRTAQRILDAPDVPTGGG